MVRHITDETLLLNLTLRAGLARVTFCALDIFMKEGGSFRDELLRCRIDILHIYSLPWQDNITKGEKLSGHVSFVPLPTHPLDHLLYSD